MTRHSRFVPVLLLLVALVATGCPLGDPATSSQIRNDTASTVEVRLTLDTDQWSGGFEPEEFQEFLAERTDDWLEDELEPFAEGDDGAQLLSTDLDRFAGTFELAPSALLVVNDSLGKGPFLYLTEIVLSNEASSKTFEGEE